ncbi:MAG: class II aldolase/adducin family protein [Comamonadaceae bacterium]|nr:MAG: class II aldolase/adducin family protein [Comamonadaceae bacterium]
MALSPPDPALVEQLVMANRILDDQGVVDGFGHVSVRHDTSAEHFLLSCNRAPGLVVKSDILVYNLDGEPVEKTDRRSYLERFIHSEIYRARPDVVSVIHSHSPSVIPFGITGQRLRPVFHMSGFLGSGSSLFDIRAGHGNTDLLIRDLGLGRDLAKALGQHTCVLMRGHGSTVVGPSLQRAVYRAVYAEENARLQLSASTLGRIEFLTPEEAELAMATTEGQVQRPWELWSRRIGRVE